MSVGEQLAGWGKVAMLETRGRTSGSAVLTPVGYVEDGDGSLIVAAGGETSDWALNLRSDPRCRATIAEETASFSASEIHGDERNRALTELILRYGTPAERLGRGPVFRLVRERASDADGRAGDADGR